MESTHRPRDPSPNPETDPNEPPRPDHALAALCPWTPLAARRLPSARPRGPFDQRGRGRRSGVPGLPGVRFEPGTGTTHFDRVYGHPGGHWILTAHADLPSGEDECLIADGELVLREGVPPWTASGERCGTLDRRCCINGRGDLVFATNTSANALDDFLPVRWASGAWGSLPGRGDRPGPPSGHAGRRHRLAPPAR